MNEQNILQEKMKELPPVYQKALMKINLPEKFTIISKKENLNLAQLSELEIEITLSILGLRSSEEFVDNIQKKLEISEEKAISITETVNAEIFLEIRKEMQNNTDEDTEPAQLLETPEEILKHIEDGGLELPAPSLTEHLLNNSVTSAKIEEKVIEKRPYSADPYREAI